MKKKKMTKEQIAVTMINYINMILHPKGKKPEISHPFFYLYCSCGRMEELCEAMNKEIDGWTEAAKKEGQV